MLWSYLREDDDEAADDDDDDNDDEDDCVSEDVVCHGVCACVCVEDEVFEHGCGVATMLRACGAAMDLAFGRFLSKQCFRHVSYDTTG